MSLRVPRESESVRVLLPLGIEKFKGPRVDDKM